MYAELPETIFPELWSYTESDEISVEINNVPTDWQDVIYDHTDSYDTKNTNITIKLGPHGFFS